MSFQEFEQAIASAQLRAVAGHWNKVRGSKLMPAWSDIRPKDIAAQLPILWAYKYDRDADAFTGRLSGESIVKIFGENLRGKPMAEVYPTRDYLRLFSISKRVVREPALFRTQGMVFAHVDHYGEGERIVMPLASDGVNGDEILGATVYEPRQGRLPSQQIPDVENWFAL